MYMLPPFLPSYHVLKFEYSEYNFYLIYGKFCISTTTVFSLSFQIYVNELILIG